MRIPPTLLWLLLAASSSWAQTGRERPPARGLEPLVSETIEDALERARKGGHTTVVAVGLGEGSSLPPLFRDPSVARASRAILSLVGVEYSPEDDFFRSHAIRPDKVPAFLLLDTHGNVLDRCPPDVTAPVLLATARNTQALSRSIEKEIPTVLEAARKLDEAGDEPGLLRLLRPWLERHYRGYAGLDQMLDLLLPRGQRRLEGCQGPDPAQSIGAYRTVAEEYAHSPIQAEAVWQIALLQDQGGDRAASRQTLQQILDDLPWPENDGVHARVRQQLQKYRRDEIEKRRKEMEQKKEDKTP